MNIFLYGFILYSYCKLNLVHVNFRFEMYLFQNETEHYFNLYMNASNRNHKYPTFLGSFRAIYFFWSRNFPTLHSSHSLSYGWAQQTRTMARWDLINGNLINSMHINIAWLREIARVENLHHTINIQYTHTASVTEWEQLRIIYEKQILFNDTQWTNERMNEC